MGNLRDWVSANLAAIVEIGIWVVKIPQLPPPLDDMFDREDLDVLEKILSSDVKASHNGHYRHWDEIRFREPA